MAILIEDQKVKDYCQRYSSDVSDLFDEIVNYNTLNTRCPEDGSDFIQGRFLSFISHMIRPELIVELGTYTGYSTLCLAEGLVPDGKIISIEAKESLKPVIQRHLRKAGVLNKVDLRIGVAQEILPTITGPIDLVFLDANKRRYFVFFELLIEKLRKGGFILADNTLWKGTVLDSDKDKMSQAIHDFNRFVYRDDRVEQVILPLRDGISLIRKL